jgi:hypothetical protein
MDTEMTTRKTFTIGQVWPEFVKRLPRTQPRYRVELGANPFAAMQRGLTDEEARALLAQQINAQQYAASIYSNSPLGGLWDPFTLWSSYPRH